LVERQCHILVKCFLKNRAALLDAKKDLPTGPLFRMLMVPNLKTERIDMLKNKNDEVNFENIMTSELYKVTLDGTATLFKKNICMRESFSPDGNYIMLTTIKTILLYRSFGRFPSKSVICDKTDKKSKWSMSTLTEIIPKVLWQFERQRNMSWRSDKPATLVYAEALDGPATKVDFR
jgi:hypothetical protein